jgi:hypothetical protein
MDNEKEKWKSQRWYVTEAVIASLHQFNQTLLALLFPSVNLGLLLQVVVCVVEEFEELRRFLCH